MHTNARDLSQDIRPLVRRIGKLPRAWQREDLVRVCLDTPVRIVNFRKLEAEEDSGLNARRALLNGRPCGTDS